jgi:hypothetical protein
MWVEHFAQVYVYDMRTGQKVLIYFCLGCIQSTDFLPCVGCFSLGWAKKNLHEKGKYHAAAGYNHFCIRPMFIIAEKFYV